MTDRITLTEAEWREKLTPEQYHVLREAGTERAFTGKYEKNKAAGEYLCAGCGQPLFASQAKYDSGSGWPSFTTPADETAVAINRDMPHGMVRTEVVCARCQGHFGPRVSLTGRGQKGCATASILPRSTSNRRIKRAIERHHRSRPITIALCTGHPSRDWHGRKCPLAGI